MIFTPLNREEAKAMASFLLPMLRIPPDTRITAEDALNHAWLADADINIPIPITADYPKSDEEDEEDTDDDDDKKDNKVSISSLSPYVFNSNQMKRRRENTS